MDKNKKIVIKRSLLIILLSYILYTTLTTDGALRFAIMQHTNPIHAYTTGFVSRESVIDGKTLYLGTKSPGKPLGHFTVENIGPFKVGIYYGAD